MQSIEDASSHLQHLARRLDNHHPSHRLRQRAQRCDELDLRLQRAMQLSVAQANSSLDNLQLRLRNLSPGRELQRRQEKLTSLRARLEQSVNSVLSAAKVHLGGHQRALQTISPLNTLARGYAIVQNVDGEVITHHEQVSTDTPLELRLAEGELGAKVTRIGPK